MKKLVLIPAFNEELSLPGIIAEIKRDLSAFDILVVDDGSSDNSRNIAFSQGVKVISLPFNVGVGGAVRVGFKYAFLNGYELVIQIDADGQHIPTEANKLLNSMTTDCVVVGSRFSNNSKTYKTNFAKKLAIKTLAVITSFICKTKLTDVSSGFRLTTGKAIQLFAAEYPRDYLGDTVESLILAHNNGVTLIEIPVLMRQREYGNPSQNLFKSLWHLIRILMVVILSLLQKSNSRGN